MTIRGVLWDVGRVKMALALAKGIGMLADAYGQRYGEVYPFVTASPEFYEFERGRLPFDEFVEACNVRFGRCLATTEFAACMHAQLSGPISGVLAVRDELRVEGVFQATASNVNSVHHARILREYPEVFSGVDFVGASFQLQVRKGDAKFFPVLLARINACRNGQGALSFEELAFVDDIHDNLAQAAKHGIQPVHFDPDHLHAVPRLREDLAKLGLPVKQIAVANDDVGESHALSA